MLLSRWNIDNVSQCNRQISIYIQILWKKWTGLEQKYQQIIKSLTLRDTNFDIIIYYIKLNFEVHFTRLNIVLNDDQDTLYSKDVILK